MSSVRRSSPRKQAKTPWEQAKLAELPVWLVSEQCYCEQRVALWTMKPGRQVSIPRELEDQEGPASPLADSAIAGKRLHSALASDVPEMSVSQVRRHVAGGDRLALIESPLRAKYGETPIAGIPDAITFGSGRVNSIIDYKLTDSNQLQMGHRVQLLLYGWLLHKNHFQIGYPLCISVLVPTQQEHLLAQLESSDRENLAHRVSELAADIVDRDPFRLNWYSKQAYITRELWVRLRIFPFDAAVARRELRFFVPYWHGKRAPVPTKNFKKCQQCLYNSIDKCDESLTRGWDDEGDA